MVYAIHTISILTRRFLGARSQGWILYACVPHTRSRQQCRADFIHGLSTCFIHLALEIEYCAASFDIFWFDCSFLLLASNSRALMFVSTGIPCTTA